MHFQEKTLDDLLMQILSRLLKSNNVNKASRGETTELIGVLLSLKDPRARLSRTERKGKVFSGLGELLWYLSGNDSLEFIEYYLPRYREDSEPNGKIYGAYGPRIFNMRGLNQLKSVEKLLRKSPSSRRAVIQIFNAEDIERRRKEIPCTLSWQFIIRNSKLDMCTCMRSNDAFWGLPHDVFAFTMIQELMARSLEVELGTYHHFIGSLHLYEAARDAAIGYISEGWQPTKSVAMPEMKTTNPWSDVESLLEAESAIRSGQDIDIRNFNLNSYWEDLARLLQVFHFSKTDQRKRISSIRRNMHDAVYDSFIERKEPSRLTVQPNKQLSLHFAPPDEVSRVPTWFTKIMSGLIAKIDTAAGRTAGLIPWACPVPAFGDIAAARVATAGINPSNIEFMDDSGAELSVQKRRLETLSSLGLHSWSELDDQTLQTVCTGCIDYFRVNPYRRWFNGLDELFRDVPLSYYSEATNICHLDLVPFATTEKWTDIKPSQRRKLSEISGKTFGVLLQNSSIRVLILNGATVIKEVENLAKLKLKRRAVKTWILPRNNSEGVMGYSYTGRIESINGVNLDQSILVLGFNHNIQSSFGVSQKVKNSIRKWVTLGIQEELHEKP